MKLYLGNLPYSASEADIEQWLSEKGITADTVTLVRDRFTGDPRGFGFIEINNDEQAESAIQQCNGADLMGRSVVVNEARPKPQSFGGGGGPPQDRPGGRSRGKRGRGGGRQRRW